MPASISMPKILSPSSSSSTSRRKPAPAAFTRNPGCRATPPRSLRPNSRSQFAGSCHAGASSGTSLAEYSGEGASAVGYEDGGPPFVNPSSSDVRRTELTSLKDEPAPSSRLTTVPAPRKGNGAEGQLESTPAYPAAMKALYGACLAGNATEHLWNFTWPAAVATLHQSLLPVALLGFFTKLVVFVAGPLVGNLVSSLPLIPTYCSLTVIQTAAHLVSAAMITYAFTIPRASAAPELLLRPWFAVLVASTAVDSLSRVSLGIIAERDFVVQLAGEGRRIALAQANATLSRVDLICETAGASVFAFLLSKNDPLTCIKLSCLISLSALPVHIFLGGTMNQLADGIFDHCEDRGGLHAASTFDIQRIVKDAVATIRRGWREYISQPVLPASLAFVLVCFNVALAPGALMTTFLIHHGVSPLVLGAFGGSSALMGILATFMTPSLVKELGILKAGAAGLLGQSALLGTAVLVYLTGSIPRCGALFAFLGLIVVSRLGHMAYSVIGLQVVQTGSPMGKAKLIGATEIAVASLAELGMMAVAVAARDVSRFGAVAVLSAAAVAAAAWLYCAWLANHTQQLKTLFPS
ncbi:solute carrier family 40 member 3, chloroplastic-like isoform X2 [Hordeum vulgare subsp. vulgare]|uniref:Solute carrier family 40 member n=1 Tax=Hordeum vulgare subsp. vulgare TaxID=112509 RepID=A0A8I6Y0M8_HORVV|nr:solute carrier family 40 member 3, chloroplastic-like isoform X2 [Hordeum vulgare subsp. vulgare]